MNKWVTEWGATVSLLANLLLVAVTAWYAALTRTLAKSSKESSASAREAAEQAALSVEVAMASVEVEFDAAPFYRPEVMMVREGERLDDSMQLVFDIDVTSAGATVFVHSVRLDFVVLVAVEGGVSA